SVAIFRSPRPNRNPQIIWMQQRICPEPVDSFGDSETFVIIGAAMAVHRRLGRGFLEPVYQAALEVECRLRGISYQREVELPVYYREVDLGVRYRADFLCFDSVLVELKALDRLTTREEGQLIHYLLAARMTRGLLVNFGRASLQYKRFVSPFQSDV